MIPTYSSVYKELTSKQREVFEDVIYRDYGIKLERTSTARLLEQVVCLTGNPDELYRLLKEVNEFVDYDFFCLTVYVDKYVAVISERNNEEEIKFLFQERGYEEFWKKYGRRKPSLFSKFNSEAMRDKTVDSLLFACNEDNKNLEKEINQEGIELLSKIRKYVSSKQDSCDKFLLIGYNR